MPLSESDTRAKLIDPAIHLRGWTEDLIRREETAGAIDLGAGGPRRRARGRVDYVLRVKVTLGSQPVAVALIEAKAEQLPPAAGLEQAKLYGQCRRLNVPFVFSSNGHRFVEFDRFTGLTSQPSLLAKFPTPDDLRNRYEKGQDFKLGSKAAQPLLAPYSGGEATRRYYQDAAIRATLEKFARGQRRALLSLATGAGKTFIAVNLLKRIADAGQLRRALFVCDDGLCSVDQYVFEVDEEKASSSYLSAFVRSPNFLRHATTICNTPGQLPRVRSEEVADVKVPLPPLLEQRRIAAMLNEQMEAATALRKGLEAQLAEIDALPAALLRRAFSGAL